MKKELIYLIDFGNHLRCKLKIDNGKIKVEGAINGWGNSVPLDEIIVTELTLNLKRNETRR